MVMARVATTRAAMTGVIRAVMAKVDTGTSSSSQSTPWSEARPNTGVGIRSSRSTPWSKASPNMMVTSRMPIRMPAEAGASSSPSMAWMTEGKPSRTTPKPATTSSTTRSIAPRAATPATIHSRLAERITILRTAMDTTTHGVAVACILERATTVRTAGEAHPRAMAGAAGGLPRGLRRRRATGGCRLRRTCTNRIATTPTSLPRAAGAGARAAESPALMQNAMVRGSWITL
mmetsp:Transcript_77983/g.253014  ORF Transcript_77983/g.253014 Transcript_77983/m.253014 type:complete len:232 (+) Transcript_77983:778-1473(+)